MSQLAVKNVTEKASLANVTVTITTAIELGSLINCQALCVFGRRLRASFHFCFEKHPGKVKDLKQILGTYS